MTPVFCSGGLLRRATDRVLGCDGASPQRAPRPGAGDGTRQPSPAFFSESTGLTASGEVRPADSEHRNENDPAPAATGAGSDHEEGALMTTPTITTPPEAPADPIGVDIHVSVNDRTAISVSTFTNGANLRIGASGYSAGLRIGVSGPLDGPEHDLAVLEDFLDRARQEVTKARLRMLPCEGACQPLLWPADGFICAAYNTGLDAHCSRVEGHDGPHIACRHDEHNTVSWPGRKAA